MFAGCDRETLEALKVKFQGQPIDGETQLDAADPNSQQWSRVYQVPVHEQLEIDFEYSPATKQLELCAIEIQCSE